MNIGLGFELMGLFKDEIFIFILGLEVNSWPITPCFVKLRVVDKYSYNIRLKNT